MHILKVVVCADKCKNKLLLLSIWY